jgi:uncharacterized iron-regulated membrane protein
MKESKNRKTLFRKVVEWLHLWLGLASGIVVFVVCFTAAIWVFRDEILHLTRPFQFIETQDRPFLPPSVLINKADTFF